METGIRSIFLSWRHTLLASALVSTGGFAQTSETDEIIDPNIARRDVSVAQIDTENFEVQAFAGWLSIEDFGSDWVYGARLAYHVTENVFVEGSYGLSKAGKTSFEELSGGAPILTDSERDYSYYNLVAGYNLNGEIYVADGLTLNSSTYFVAGAGSTDFGGDDRFTLTYGAGIRLLLTDEIALHLDIRDNVFDSDVLGKSKTVHNIEYTLGASVFF